MIDDCQFLVTPKKARKNKDNEREWVFTIHHLEQLQEFQLKGNVFGCHTVIGLVRGVGVVL